MADSVVTVYRPVTHVAVTQHRHVVVSTKHQVSVVRVATPVCSPPSSGGSPGARHEHNQPVAAATWVIAHNLGYLPVATALTVGNVEMLGEVVHLSNNVTNIVFDTPVAGRAILV